MIGSKGPFSDHYMSAANYGALTARGQSNAINGNYDLNRYNQLRNFYPNMMQDVMATRRMNASAPCEYCRGTRADKSGKCEGCGAPR
jgi:hypothetical protein